MELCEILGLYIKVVWQGDNPRLSKGLGLWDERKVHFKKVKMLIGWDLEGNRVTNTNFWMLLYVLPMIRSNTSTTSRCLQLYTNTDTWSFTTSNQLSLGVFTKVCDSDIGRSWRWIELWKYRVTPAMEMELCKISALYEKGIWEGENPRLSRGLGLGEERKVPFAHGHMVIGKLVLDFTLYFDNDKIRHVCHF